MKKFERLAKIFQCHDTGKLIIRLTIGLLMLPHGIAKLSGLGFIENLLASVGLPSFIAYGVYIGEIVAPLMIIFGFRARLGALLFCINMVFVILLAHSKEIFTISKNGGLELEIHYFYLFIALSLILLGAGKFAVSRKSQWD